MQLRDLAVEFASAQKFFVRSVADDLAVFHHEDAVGVEDGAHPLSDDEHRRAAHIFAQAGAQRAVGLHVQRGKTVVEQVDFRLLHHGAGNGHALTLAAGKVRAALGNGGVVRAVFLLDEFIGAGDMRRLPPLFFAALLVAKAQVGGHVTGKEHVLLRHIADETAQLLQFVFFYIHTVHVNVAEHSVVEPRHQLEYAGFAAARAADDGRDLSGTAFKADVLEHGLVRPGIGESHMVENHAGAFRALAGAVVAALDGAFRV